MACSLFFVSCESSDTGRGETIRVEWKNSAAALPGRGYATLLISGTPGQTYEAEITEGKGWCSFDSQSEKSFVQNVLKEGQNVQFVYYAPNATGKARKATVTIRTEGGEEKLLDLTQPAAAGGGTDTVRPFPSGWAELPARRDSAVFRYVTHRTRVQGKEMRNYSLCYDVTKKAALWVAYPLHKVYLGGEKRSDAWEFDPEIGESFQPDLRKSYKGSYDRGHQLPSGDRTATRDMNEQTFYFSNMTPQLSRLNQDMWAELEAKVRSCACPDTLYVVTGAWFGSRPKTAEDGSGRSVPVPDAYFKVLLRTRTGKTGKAVQECPAGELKSVGFWVEHKNYGKIQPPQEICRSVAEIERKTGFTFFPGVPPEVKRDFVYTDWNM